jgi:hypothetical protein
MAIFDLGLMLLRSHTLRVPVQPLVAIVEKTIRSC